MNEPTPSSIASDENHLIAERRGKLAKLRTEGLAYPNDFRPDHAAAALHAAYDELDKEALAEVDKHVRIAGRMMLKRVMGKASFATLQDGSGRIQIFLDRNQIGDGLYAQFKTWDIGDNVAVEGTVFKTNKGELSVHADQVRLLSK